MLRGLYTAWTGLYNEQKRLDVISNNLANSATVGYKKEGATSQSFDEVMTIKIRDISVDNKQEYIGDMSLGVKVGEVYTDYTQGNLRETGNTFDLAVEGAGFFQIGYTDSSGETTLRYTRAGEFRMTNEGYVVTVDGQHLMAESGWLQVPVDAGNITIEKDGSVYADGEKVDTILLRDFEDYNYLRKFADTMYMPVAGAQERAVTGTVLQGWTEQSNVNVINEMVNMIAITRAYEANQKVVQAYDNSMELAATSVGRI